MKILVASLAFLVTIRPSILNALDAAPAIPTSPTSPQDEPWRVHLDWGFTTEEPVDATAARGSKPTKYHCTGTVIHKNYILTAASCYGRVIDGLKREGTPLSVNLDDFKVLTYIRELLWDGSQLTGCPNSSVHHSRSASTLHVHTDYLHKSTLFDVNIALVETEKPWTLSCLPGTPTVRYQPRIAMPIASDDLLKCRAVRIGFVDHDGVVTDTDGLPQFYAVKVGRERFCRHMQRKQDGTTVFFDSFYLCATPFDKGVQPTCNGDVGGLVSCGGLMVGVMSERRERRPCDEDGTSFALYTAIGAPVVWDWIRSEVPDFEGVLVEISAEDGAAWLTAAQGTR